MVKYELSKIVYGTVKTETLETDELVIVGELRTTRIKARKLVVIGVTHIQLAATVGKILLVGGGKVANIISRKAILVSRTGITVDNLASIETICVGIERPVFIKSLWTSKAYLKKTLIGILKAKEVYIHENTSIKELIDCTALNLLDPHHWIEELRCTPLKTVFNYSVPQPPSSPQQSSL